MRSEIRRQGGKAGEEAAEALLAAVGNDLRELVAACSQLVADTGGRIDAVFGTPEVLRGTVGATQRLPRVLGKRLAKDLMFTGRRLTAEEARAAGFVSRVVQPADLENTLKEIQEVIVKASPDVLRYAKQCIDRGVELDPRGALGLELMAIEDQLASGTWLGKR